MPWNNNNNNNNNNNKNNKNDLLTFSSPNNNIYTSPTDIPSEQLILLNAIVILGGGAPTSLYEPPVYVQQRCDDAAYVVQLYQTQQQIIKTNHKNSTLNFDRNKIVLPILTLSAGTAHVPQLMSNSGFPIWESTSSAAYLHKIHGIDYNSLFVETTSYDTIGNAYFTRTSHTDINGWRNLLIVTSKFHMPRTKAIFDWIFSINPLGYHLLYLESADVGLADDALQSRIEREASSLKNIKSFVQTYQSLHDVWEFLNKQHALYTASKLVERVDSNQRLDNVNDLVKKSYGANR